MKSRRRLPEIASSFSLLPFLFLLCNSAHARHYKYIRIGQKDDAKTEPSPGVAMMGGGSDLDEAFRWMCQKANGGDFLILRAHGNGEYNSYVKGCANSTQWRL